MHNWQFAGSDQRNIERKPVCGQPNRKFNNSLYFNCWWKKRSIVVNSDQIEAPCKFHDMEGEQVTFFVKKNLFTPDIFRRRQMRMQLHELLHTTHIGFCLRHDRPCRINCHNQKPHLDSLLRKWISTVALVANLYWPNCKRKNYLFVMTNRLTWPSMKSQPTRHPWQSVWQQKSCLLVYLF